MSRDGNWALSMVSQIGENAGSDYNDGEEVQGWFGFEVRYDSSLQPVLHVYFTEDEGDGEEQTQEWNFYLKEIAK